MKTKNIRYQYLRFTLTFTLLIAGVSCTDFIEIDPPRTEIVSNTVFNNDATATSAIRGMYSLMISNTSFTRGAMEEYTGIASDELINYATRTDQLQFYQNSLTPKNGDVFAIFWQQPYKYINNANAMLEGLQKSTGMTPNGKNQIEGEAKFVRAFCHFYLATLFGDIPYITTTNYQVNSVAARMPFQEVLAQIEIDLLDARNLLSTDFSFSNGERIQPNKGAATALLARLYLYLHNWEQADKMASELIDNSTYALLTDLTKVFLANSKEAIWQLKPVIPFTNAPQGEVFIMTNSPNGTSRRVAMTPELISAFETNDLRKSKWTGTLTNATGSWSFIHKYKVRLSSTLTEYSMVLRLAEQYLIRAEARAHLENIEGAKSDLNIIRNRAGLPNTTANDKAALLTATVQERRIELCGEFGHRWLDLKRTERIDEVMSAIKTQWQTTDKLFPIPDSERLLNPNLSQNDGY